MGAEIARMPHKDPHVHVSNPRASVVNLHLDYPKIVIPRHRDQIINPR